MRFIRFYLGNVVYGLLCVFLPLLMCLWLSVLLAGCAKPYNNEQVVKEISLTQNLRNTIKGETSLPNPQKDTKGADKNNALDYAENLLFLINDNKLKSLIQIALTNNTNILTLTSVIAQARDSLGLANANMLPKLSFNMGHNFSSGNYNRYQINYTQNTINANLSLSWEIDLFGKLNSLRKSQKYQYLVAISNLEAAKVSLIGEVATNYYT